MTLDKKNIFEILIGVTLAVVLGGVIMIYANKFLDRHAEKVKESFEM